MSFFCFGGKILREMRFFIMKTLMLFLTLQLIINGKVVLDKSVSMSCEYAEEIAATYRYLLGHILSDLLGHYLADCLAGNTSTGTVPTAVCRIHTEIRLDDITVGSEVADVVTGRSVIPIYAVAERSICLTVHKAFRALRSKKKVS